MRPQNRPFVVEIKKAKRGGAPVAGAPAAPPPATWAEQFEQATALNDSAARKAAEAVFSAPRPAPAPVERPSGREPVRNDEPKAPEASGRTGRILMALEPAPAAVPAEPDAAVEDERDHVEITPRRRPAARGLDGGPVRSRAPASAAAETDREFLPARTAKVPAAVTPLAGPVVMPENPDQPSLAAAAAVVPARKGPWRRGAAAPLARGEKWKRRLPQVLR